MKERVTRENGDSSVMSSPRASAIYNVKRKSIFVSANKTSEIKTPLTPENSDYTPAKRLTELQMRDQKTRKNKTDQKRPFLRSHGIQEEYIPAVENESEMARTSNEDKSEEFETKDLSQPLGSKALYIKETVTHSTSKENINHKKEKIKVLQSTDVTESHIDSSQTEDQANVFPEKNEDEKSGVEPPNIPLLTRVVDSREPVEDSSSIPANKKKPVEDSSSTPANKKSSSEKGKHTKLHIPNSSTRLTDIPLDTTIRKISKQKKATMESIPESSKESKSVHDIEVKHFESKLDEKPIMKTVTMKRLSRARIASIIVDILRGQPLDIKRKKFVKIWHGENKGKITPENSGSKHSFTQENNDNPKFVSKEQNRVKEHLEERQRKQSICDFPSSQSEMVSPKILDIDIGGVR